MKHHFTSAAQFITVVVVFVSALAVNAQQIVGSDRNALVLCIDGAVFAWGENRDGLLGDGTTTESPGAVRSHVPSIVNLYGSAWRIVAVASDGNVYAWGWSTNTEFGMPSWESFVAKPSLVPHVTGVRKVVVNSGNAYYLLDDGRLKVSGMNWRGNYGNGSTTRLDSASAFVAVDSVVDIFCASGTGFAVRSDGSVLAWGTNEWNNIDSTSELYYPMPKTILRTNGVVSTCGTSGGFSGNLGSMRIVTVDGDVWVWGRNDKNQLGVASMKQVRTPTRLTFPKKVIAVTGGYDHTVVLLEDGTVWTWGDNGFGQLGNPYYNNTAEPVKAIGLANVVVIGSGSYSSYAIMRDGSLHGWGDNTYRQLNRDDAPRQYTAVPLPVPCGLVSSITSDDHTTTARCTPSPVVDILTIPIVEGTTRVEILTLQGKRVRSVLPTPSTTTCTLDLSSESPGVYVVVRSQAEVFSTEMIVKY